MAGYRHHGGAHVYAILDGDDLVKVGRSTAPENRLVNLQGRNRKHLRLGYISPISMNASYIELRAQTLLVGCFVGGEWFRCTCDEAQEAIEQAFKDVEAGWRPPKGIRGGGLPFHPSRVPPQDWPARWK